MAFNWDKICWCYNLKRSSGREVVSFVSSVSRKNRNRYAGRVRKNLLAEVFASPLQNCATRLLGNANYECSPRPLWREAYCLRRCPTCVPEGSKGCSSVAR